MAVPVEDMQRWSGWRMLTPAARISDLHACFISIERTHERAPMQHISLCMSVLSGEQHATIEHCRIGRAASGGQHDNFVYKGL